MTSFISWNCRGLRTRLDDLKYIISPYQPACVALQETFLKRTMTMRVRGYNCVRRNLDGNESPTGGVCLFTSNLYPSNIVTLHTSLQDVAVRIHIRSLVTVCFVYLPPNDVVPQVDLNQLVNCQLLLFCSVTLTDTALCGGMLIPTLVGDRSNS
ncbi:RNA-directed DNA polymerase from mobile element jockey [Trichonephila clavipes]|nr:RNA-directed DNA polymerase from mobile element jockey [Trichonephila clavipes]